MVRRIDFRISERINPRSQLKIEFDKKWLSMLSKPDKEFEKKW